MLSISRISENFRRCGTAMENRAFPCTGPVFSVLLRFGTFFFSAAPWREQRIKYKKERAIVVCIPFITAPQWILP
jgi:hypothetical protein